MKIKDILGQGKPTLSFEVFPPKTEDKYESVEKAAAEIAKLNPAFMSVTYGAGASIRWTSPPPCIMSTR
jgi:methylenetetrahydrofolate reductase (NADPH)